MKKASNSSDDENEVYAIVPENTLRKKIGRDVDIEKILTPEKINECQEIINKAHVDLFDDALKNLAALEDEYAKAIANPAKAQQHVRKIARQAFIIKGRLEAIGLTLGFEVAESLHKYSKAITSINKEQLLVLRKHLDIMTVVLKERLQGDGGEMGKTMLDTLSQLIQKIHSA